MATKKKSPAGSRVRYGPTGRPQLVKTGGYQWSDEAEEAFFDHLGATCNVRASAAEVGFTTFTVYRQRRLRPDFAARWQAVLEQGYARLEMALLQAALDSMDGVDFDEDRPIPKMSVEQAMNLLKLHGPQARREQSGRPGRRPAPRGIDFYRESILKKVAAIRAARLH
jgi:hypothetical protein